MNPKSTVKSMMCALSSVVLSSLIAAEPLSWERTPNRPAPAQFDVFHGESLDFRCTFTGFGALPFAGASDVRLWYQTNGMGAAWWSIPATVSSNALAATFTPDRDPGAERLAVFFGAPSNSYAAAQVRFRNSPGASPNDLAPPSILDWQAELAAATNALWESSAAAFMPKTNTYTKSEADARIVELAPAPGNYETVSNRAMSAIQSHQDISGKADKGDTYTKAETDARIGELAPVPGNYETVSNRAMSALQSHQDISSKADKANTYTKAEVNNAIMDAETAARSQGYTPWSVVGYADCRVRWGSNEGTGWLVEEMFIDESTNTTNWNITSIGKGDKDSTSLTWRMHMDEADENYTATRTAIATGISAENATNIAESVVNATVTGVVRAVSFKVKDYIFDPVTEVCWRRQMVNGFLDYIAVTNIDVTLPENYEALEALERRDNQ